MTRNTSRGAIPVESKYTKNPFVFSSQYFTITQSQLNFIADPYVRVSFLHQSSKTKTVKQALSPTWNQRIIFEEVDIYGELLDNADNPPTVVMELFDCDKVLKLIRFSFQRSLFTISYDCLFVVVFFVAAALFYCLLIFDLPPKIYFDYSNLSGV